VPIKASATQLINYSKSGREYWLDINIQPVFGSENEVVKFIAIESDITAQKLAEEELRKLSRAIEQSTATVLMTDRNGRIEYVNPHFTRLTGYTPEEARGKNPRILKSGAQPPEFYRELWSTLKGGKDWRGEFCNKKKNGEIYWESATISPIKNQAGEITHFVAVKEDITERKRVAEELQRAKEAAEAATQAKSVFLANMSHEIRTPMNAILGFSQLMLRDPALTPGQQQHLDIINRSGEHLLALINDVLEMSKIEAGRVVLNPTDFDLHVMLDDLEGIFRDASGGEKVAVRHGIHRRPAARGVRR
jgi:PAS domain S-box-containing protein